MNIILPFLFGFLAAAIGVFPPGLINMTATKVSLTDGKKQAMMFVLGALIVIFFQTYISVIFAEYIDKHDEVVVLFREIGLAVFIILTFYFLVFAKKPNIKDQENLKVKSKRSRFFMGMVLSAINFFPIPYYVLISITLASFNVFSFEVLPICSFVFGVVTGSFLIFYWYVVFFNKLKSKTDFFVNNMNRIIGSITGLVSIITLINVIQYYWK
ncbi:LysE family transporter [Flavobacterium sp.]|uniref:LysE family transporter n=1 Tax=Flavobacterium sp. TaxID=239 RepID=UPI0037520915